VPNAELNKRTVTVDVTPPKGRMAMNRSGVRLWTRREGPNRLAVAAILATLVVSAAACGTSTSKSSSSAAPGAQHDSITVILANSAVRAPFPVSAYSLGIDEGLFAKEGIDKVTLQVAAATGPATQLVGGGKADFGAVISTSAFLPVASQLGNVSMIGQDIPDLGEAVVAKKSSGINSPADLMGKTVGFATGSPQAALWPTYRKNANVPLESVKVANINANAQYQLLLAGKLDAIVTAATLAVPSLTALGSGELSVLPFANEGLQSMPGTGIISNDMVLNGQSNLAARFLAAASAAFSAAIANPTLAEKSLDKRYPGEVTHDAYVANTNIALTQFRAIDPSRSPLAISSTEWAQTLKVAQLSNLIKADNQDVSAYLKQIPIKK